MGLGNISLRTWYLALAVGCAALLGFALYKQYQDFLDPCPLCVFQRVAVIGLGAVFLVAALHDPKAWGGRVYVAFLGLFTIGGVGVAGWHARLQNLPPDEVPSCGPGLDYMLDNFIMTISGVFFQPAFMCTYLALGA